MPLSALPQRPWHIRIVGITEREMNFKSADPWNRGANEAHETEFCADLWLQPQDRNLYDGAVRFANGVAAVNGTDDRSECRHGVCLPETDDSQAAHDVGLDPMHTLKHRHFAVWLRLSASGKPTPALRRLPVWD